MNCLSIEGKENWAIKLSNLRLLETSVDSYIQGGLQLARPSSHIDLVSIATEESEEEILKLLELVVFVLINCPQKDTFIHRIMQLDSTVQTSLMKLIKGKLTQKENKSVFLLNKIQELQLQLETSKREKDSLAHERDELRTTITDFESELHRRTHFRNYSIESFSFHDEDSEKRLKEMQEFMLKQQQHYKEEINSLTEELESSNASVSALVKEKEEIEAQRIEKTEALKNKAIMLQSNNDRLNREIQELRIKVGDFITVKQELQSAKELITEKHKKNDRQFEEIEELNKRIRELQKTVNSQSEMVHFYKNENRELERELKLMNEGNSSEDSIMSVTQNLQEDIEMRRRRPTQPPRYDAQQEVLTANIYKKKEKIKQLRESARMLAEEFSQRSYESAVKIQLITSQNQILSTHLQEETNVPQNLQTKYDQALQELESYKKNKEVLMRDIKTLYEEKELLYKKYIEAKEETIGLNSIISDKELLIRQKELSEKQLEGHITELIEREKARSEPKDSTNNSLVQMEHELISKKHEISNLKLSLEESAKRIEELTSIKETSLRNAEKQHKEKIFKMKLKHKAKIKELAEQTQDAIREIEKDKFTLAKRLKKERNYGINEFNKKFADAPQFTNHEFLTLKEELEKSKRDIEYLTNANVELKHVWKDTARMLKQVWKVIGQETKKIQSASRNVYRIN